MIKNLPFIMGGVISFAASAQSDFQAAAEDVSVDKSSYSLFHPTPEEQMRGFSPDRPTKLNSPYTLDAGHFSYEADFVNSIYDRYNAAKVTTSNHVFIDPTFKVGLSNSTDFEIALSPVNINSSNDRNAGVKSTVGGFGDIYGRIKFNIFGDDGGDYAFALVPYIKAPSASHSIGNEHWEGGGYAPITVTFTDNWSLTVQSEIDFLENASLDGMHINYQTAVSVGHPLIYDNLTANVGFWSLVDGNKNAENQYTADFALALMIGDNLQLDGGVSIGLNKAAQDVQTYLGISQRF